MAKRSIAKHGMADHSIASRRIPKRNIAQHGAGHGISHRYLTVNLRGILYRHLKNDDMYTIWYLTVSHIAI